jgi:hypothetical protein
MRQLMLRITCVTGLMVVLAACTATSHSTQPKPTAASSSPPPNKSLTATPSAVDMRAAEHAILKLTDLGSGFIQTPYQPTAQSGRDQETFNSCIGRPSTTSHQTAVVYSMQFAKGDSEKIYASITFVDTDSTAQEDIAALQDSRGKTCTKQSFIQQLAEVGDTAAVTTDPLTPSPTGGVPSANYRIRTQVPVGQDVLPFFVDLAQVTKGRAEVSATFQDVNQPVPASLERRVMAAMLGRL